MKINLTIASIWIVVNIIAYLIGGLFAAVVSTYAIMIILWIFRNKIK